MSRFLASFVLAFGLSGVVPAQDLGRPPAPRPVPAPALGCVVVCNNTNAEAVYVLSSSKGTVRGLLRPGASERVSYYNDGKPRVLTAFKAASGELLSSRTILCVDGNIYDVVPSVVVVPVPMPMPPEPLPQPPTLPLPRNN